jgi:hypothetical protein
MYIRTYEFPAVWVHEHDAYIHAVHRADMSSSVFAPPQDLDAFREFKKAAREMGYSNVMRYATEHELAHQHVSLAMGRECSWIVWNDAHKDNPIDHGNEWPNRPQDEEHLVNRLQRFVNLGIEDTEGCLRGVFGNRLEAIASQFLPLARPWLQLSLQL